MNTVTSGFSSEANKTTDMPTTSYHEVTVGKTLYRVTSFYEGKSDLRSILEELTVSRLARDSVAIPTALC